MEAHDMIRVLWSIVVFCIPIGVMLGCNGRLAGTGSETASGTKAYVFLPNGNPAPHARVTLFAVSDTSRIPQSTIYADSNGAYSLDNVADGMYNVWIEKDTFVAFLDSTELSADHPEKDSVTMYPGFAFSGIVGLEPNHNPQTVFAQLVGTGKYANVSIDGKFTISGLAAGTYSLLVTTTLTNYTTTYRQIVLTKEGKQTPASTDTIPMIYTGIPVVRGLSGRYDTLSGRVIIWWNKTHYHDFADYLVFRDKLPAVLLGNSPLTAVHDTIFYDTLPVSMDSSDTIATAGTNSADEYAYRVMVRNNSGDAGKYYKSVIISVPRKAAPYASADFTYKKYGSGETIQLPKIGDTILIIASVTCPQGISALAWYSAKPAGSGSDSLLKNTSFSLQRNTRNDTVKHVLGRSLFSADSSCIKIVISDGKGTKRTLVEVIHADTTASSPDQPATVVAAFLFSGNLRDTSGNGNNGVAFGGGFVTDRFGNKNCAYGFDGTGENNYIEVLNPLNLPSGDVPKSLCGWMLLGPKAGVGKSYYDCDLGGFGTASYGSNFSLGINGDYNCVTVWGWSDVADWHSTIAPQPYVDQKWHHFAVTYDGTKTTIYIDGVEKDATTSFRWTTIPEHIILGNQINKAGHEIEGSIDDIYIYKGCLSASAVRALAQDKP